MPEEAGKVEARKPSLLMVIPTLGERPTSLRETLQSLRDQQPGVCEVLIVCPAPAHAARNLAAEFNARVADEPEGASGMSSAINAGFSKAQPWHKYVSWLGDDDLVEPWTLAGSVAALDRQPEAVVAFGYCRYIDTDGRGLFVSRAGRFAPWLMTWGPDLVPSPGAVMRRSAVEAVGCLDATLKYAMDLDLFLKLRREGTFINMGRVLASFRWHATSTTVANRAASADEAQMVKRRHLPPALRRLAPLWEMPVRRASHLAARRVNAQARGASRPA